MDQDTSGLTSPEAVIERRAATAEALRRVAEVAPEEVRAAQERRALLAETIVARLRAEPLPPTTSATIVRAGEIGEAVIDELGGFEEEGTLVVDFVNAECPFSFNL